MTEPSAVNLLLHPIRLRIVQALVGRNLTAHELAQLLPDIPQTSLYRQLHHLADGGLVRVVAEQRIRGTVERTYALVDEQMVVTQAELSTSDVGLRRSFSVFLSVLLGDWERYLQAARASSHQDAVESYQEIRYLTDTEAHALAQAIQATLLAFGSATPTPGRRRWISTYIQLPGEERPPDP